MARTWWMYSLSGCAMLVGYPGLSPRLQDALHAAVAGLAVGAAVAAMRLYPQAQAGGWYLLAVIQVAHSIVDARDGETASALAVGLLCLVYYPLFIIGLVLLIRGHNPRGQPAAGPALRWPPSHLLLLSLGLTAVADVTYAAATMRGEPVSGIADVAWSLGSAALISAALYPSMRALGLPVLETTARFGPQQIMLIAAGMLTTMLGTLGASRSSSAVDITVFTVGTLGVSLLLLSRTVSIVRHLEQAVARAQALRAEADTREERRRWSERRFRSIVHSSSDVMLLARPDGTITWCGDSIERICGYQPADLTGREMVDFLHPDDVSVAAYFAESLVVPGSSAWLDCRLRLADGSYRIFQVTGRNALNDPAVDSLLFTGLDVTERRQLADQLIERAFFDHLTGLANRALLMDRVDRAIAQHDQDGRHAAVLLIGLDDFKTVNDSLGHEAGDQVLRQTAERLTERLRVADTAARIGGDEFAILLDDVNTEQAGAAASRVLGALREPFLIDDHEVYTSASIGSSTTSGKYDDPDVMLRDANIAMHRAKSSGKNRCEAFLPSMRADAVRRLELHGDLQRAVDRNEFVVFYQPIIELSTNRPSGFEALVRWQHPTHGLLGPDRFIQLAEETGLVIPMGRQILHRACCQASRWHTTLGSELRMAVNVSAKQVADGRLLDDVTRAMRVSGIDPSKLTLELTESALMADIDLAAKRLKALRSLGVRIAIDDFGTGYSSLAYLDRLPIDLIKIDRSFVATLDDPMQEATLVRIMVDLAHHLDIPVVAEGIETRTQRDRLVALGCPLGQGYLFSRPQDPQALEGALTDLLAEVR
ncbi:MAG: EAL domain-containing protein [Dactylosporangium sp.]|nr:EAL domain-containing protein [Dactylosporangium sp.]NNJ60492.1 EAL domain-containing protein [Dactylosporangium sp.]